MSRRFSLDDLMRRPRSDGDRVRAFRPRTPGSLVTLAVSTAALWPLPAPLGNFAAAQAMGQASHTGFADHPGLFCRRVALTRAAVISQRAFARFLLSVHRRVVLFGCAFRARLFTVPVDPAYPYYAFSRTDYHPYRRPPRHSAFP